MPSHTSGARAEEIAPSRGAWGGSGGAPEFSDGAVVNPAEGFALVTADTRIHAYDVAVLDPLT